jgi:hypothetical protein
MSVQRRSTIALEKRWGREKELSGVGKEGKVEGVEGGTALVLRAASLAFPAIRAHGLLR